MENIKRILGDALIHFTNGLSWVMMLVIMLYTQRWYHAMQCQDLQVIIDPHGQQQLVSLPQVIQWVMEDEPTPIQEQPLAQVSSYKMTQRLQKEPLIQDTRVVKHCYGRLEVQVTPNELIGVFIDDAKKKSI